MERITAALAAVPTPSPKAGFGAVFAGLAVYSVYKYFSYTAALKAASETTSLKPSLEKGELVTILKEIEVGAKSAVKAAEAGAELVKADDKDAKARLKELVPALIRSEVTELQSTVCSAHGVKVADVAEAQRYYSKGGPSPDPAVIAATTSIMKVLAKPLMTKRRVYRIVKELHAYQLSIMRGVIEEALERAEGNPNSPVFMRTAMERPKQLAEAWIEAEHGWTEGMQAIVALGVKMSEDDPMFKKGFMSMLQEEAAKMQQASQQIMQSIVMEMQMMGGM